ncbi:hypothetical protein [Marinobacter sp. W-8]|uniref:hypothetical protein n=1 Tax=Marinobacter sp. W-8 TaxID=3369658 RepID=UPI0037C6329E
MYGEIMPALNPAFSALAAAAASVPSGFCDDGNQQHQHSSQVWASAAIHVHRQGSAQNIDGFNGYYVVRSEGGSNSTLSLFQDNATEKLREAGSRVSQHLLRNETDFDDNIKSMISENLWELYG